MGKPIEIVKTASFPEALFVIDKKIALVYVQRHRLGCVGLEFQRVYPSLGSSFNNLQGPRQRLVVVAGHLSDHKWLMPKPDGSSRNIYPRIIDHLLLFQC